MSLVTDGKYATRTFAQSLIHLDISWTFSGEIACTTFRIPALMAILSQSPQQISRQFCFQSQEGQEPSFLLTPPATSTVTMAPKLYPPKSLGRRDFDWPDSRDGTWKKWQVWAKFHTQISSCPTNGEQLSPTFLSLSPTFFSNFFSSC